MFPRRMSPKSLVVFPQYWHLESHLPEGETLVVQFMCKDIDEWNTLTLKVAQILCKRSVAECLFHGAKRTYDTYWPSISAASNSSASCPVSPDAAQYLMAEMMSAIWDSNLPARSKATKVATGGAKLISNRYQPSCSESTYSQYCKFLEYMRDPRFYELLLCQQ